MSDPGASPSREQALRAQRDARRLLGDRERQALKPADGQANEWALVDLDNARKALVAADALVDRLLHSATWESESDPEAAEVLNAILPPESTIMSGRGMGKTLRSGDSLVMESTLIDGVEDLSQRRTETFQNPTPEERDGKALRAALRAADRRVVRDCAIALTDALFAALDSCDDLLGLGEPSLDFPDGVQVLTQDERTALRDVREAVLLSFRDMKTGAPYLTGLVPAEAFREVTE